MTKRPSKGPKKYDTRPSLIISSSSRPPRFTTPTHLDVTRATRRPTISFSGFEPNRVQETILGVFKRFGLNAMDLDALIFFVLQNFDVSPGTHEHMHKTVKAHIFKNFAIHQGIILRLQEVNMRRITVCYTIDKDQE